MKKMILSIFLFQTIVCSHNTLNQIAETMSKICIKNYILTYASISTVGGAAGAIACKVLNTLESQDNQEEKNTLAIPISEYIFKKIFSELTFNLSLVSIIGLGLEGLRDAAISKENLFNIPCLTIPCYIASFYYVYNL